MSNRSVNLAEKFALALAVDLGRVLVDEDCQRRGLALASYRDEAAKWLDPFQAENPAGRSRGADPPHAYETRGQSCDSGNSREICTPTVTEFFPGGEL